MKKRALSIKQRKTTFAFDIVEMRFDYETIKLMRNKQPIETQVSEYLQHIGVKHAVSFGQIVERHVCKYDECASCNTSNLTSLMLGRELYSTPWDKKSNIAYFCSGECERGYTEDTDFSYQVCQGCGRDICVRNPRNGYQYQFREVDGDGDLDICLRCFQNRYIKAGLSLDEIKSNKVLGIFFDTDALHDAGYIKRDSRIKVHSGNVSEVRDIALEYVKQGAQVLYDYDSMSILGDEGYINIWVRLPDQQPGPAQVIAKPELVIDLPPIDKSA